MFITLKLEKYFLRSNFATLFSRPRNGTFDTFTPVVAENRGEKREVCTTFKMNLGLILRGLFKNYVGVRIYQGIRMIKQSKMRPLGGATFWDNHLPGVLFLALKNQNLLSN